jgi:hypothetical protein
LSVLRGSCVRIAGLGQLVDVENLLRKLEKVERDAKNGKFKVNGTNGHATPLVTGTKKKRA